MKKIIIACALIATGCSVIGPGQRGVRVSFGEASSDPKQPGIYFWFPVVAGIQKMNVQVQKSDVKTSAASKDMQDITTELAINWRLDDTKVVSVYKNVGDEDDILERIIQPAVSEVLKSATAKLTAEEILHKRLELKADIDAGLKQRLEAYGISLADVSIVQLSFTEGFERAVENKQIAEQRAKQAEYEALQATQTAKAEVEKAKGQAQAQNLLRASITKELLQKQAIEKWDGKFPQVMGGNGALPFINMTAKNE